MATSTQSSDHRAFEILVRQHHRRLIGYALAFVNDPHVAEDIVQEAFVTAYRKLDDFDLSSNFPAWVRSIIRYKYLEWCRTQKETPTAPEILQDIDDRHGEWERNADGREDVMAFLRQCVKKLPDAMAQVVELFYFKEMPGRDVADKTGNQEATVRKRLERARAWLGDCISQRMKEAGN